MHRNHSQIQKHKGVFTQLNSAVLTMSPHLAVDKDTCTDDLTQFISYINPSSLYLMLVQSGGSIHYIQNMIYYTKGLLHCGMKDITKDNSQHPTNQTQEISLQRMHKQRTSHQKDKWLLWGGRTRWLRREERREPLSVRWEEVAPFLPSLAC